MNKLLNQFGLRSNRQPEELGVICYGQDSSGLTKEQIQPVMEWLFASLSHAGYSGTSNLVWYNNANGDSRLEKVMRKGIREDKPTFLYRCGESVKPPAALSGYYWRLMPEHPSLRIYQLEVRA